MMSTHECIVSGTCNSACGGNGGSSGGSGGSGPLSLPSCERMHAHSQSGIYRASFLLRWRREGAELPCCRQAAAANRGRSWQGARLRQQSRLQGSELFVLLVIVSPQYSSLRHICQHVSSSSLGGVLPFAGVLALLLGFVCDVGCDTTLELRQGKLHATTTAWLSSVSIPGERKGAQVAPLHQHRICLSFA